jgi:hypothetical protein
MQVPPPLTVQDRREYESIIKALVLLLGTEADGSTRVKFDPHEMARTANYNIEISRFLDPYNLQIEVLPK